MWQAGRSLLKGIVPLWFCIADLRRIGQAPVKVYWLVGEDGAHFPGAIADRDHVVETFHKATGVSVQEVVTMEFLGEPVILGHCARQLDISLPDTFGCDGVPSRLMLAADDNPPPVCRGKPLCSPETAGLSSGGSERVKVSVVKFGARPARNLGHALLLFLSSTDQVWYSALISTYL